MIKGTKPLSVIIALFLVFALSGCGQKSSPTVSTKSQKVTVDDPTYKSLDEYKKADADKTSAAAKAPTAEPENETENKQTQTDDGNSTGYCANTNTKKFHRMECSSVKKMNPENMYKTDSREELINAGYTPCSICDP